MAHVSRTDDVFDPELFFHGEPWLIDDWYCDGYVMVYFGKAWYDMVCLIW